MVDYSMYINQGIQMIIDYLPKVLLAIVVLIVGFKLSNFVGKIIAKQLNKKKVEATIGKFLVKLSTISLKVLVFISVISILGVETTSFVAVLAAAGFAVGLALQGNLSNFSGGVLIVLFKPFKVGDLIEAQGFTGKVDHIDIFHTVLKTPDNKTIILPNGPLSNDPITNYTTEGKRRVDLTIGIGYDDDLKKAQKVITEVIAKQKNVLKNPAPLVRVKELADSSVNFTVRGWCKTADYWDVYFDLTEKIKLALDKNKINIPYPQMDVHVKKK
jgi:small conductance mechanosensitive channel